MKCGIFHYSICCFLALCFGGTLTGCNESAEASDLNAVDTTEQLAVAQQDTLAQLAKEVQLAFSDELLQFDTASSEDVNELLAWKATVAGRAYYDAFTQFVSTRLVYGYVKANADSVGEKLVAEQRAEFYDAKTAAQEARSEWMNARKLAGLVEWTDPGVWDVINLF